MSEAVRAHLFCLMGDNAQVTTGHGAAEKNEAGCLVFGEVGVGVVMLDGALDEARGAADAAALAADVGEVDSVGGCGVEDVVVSFAGDGAETFGCFKDDAKAPLRGHRQWCFRSDAAEEKSGFLDSVTATQWLRSG